METLVRDYLMSPHAQHGVSARALTNGFQVHRKRRVHICDSVDALVKTIPPFVVVVRWNLNCLSTRMEHGRNSFKYSWVNP